MKEINFSDWYYAISGLAGNTLAAKEILELAEQGNLVVIDGEGKRHIPIKIPAHEVYWGLEPEKK